MRWDFLTVWNETRRWVARRIGWKAAPTDRIHTTGERKFDSISHVAVAIKTIDGTQQHIGLIHRTEQDRQLHLLHLQWHNKLADEVPTNDFRWVDPAIPTRRARQVAAKCRQIARANGRYVPYGLSPPLDIFDAQTAKFLFGPTKTGLTCASFVLAVFEYARIRLIRYATWPSRDDDAQWQAKVLSGLRHPRSEATPEHIAAVAAEVGCARYRPEEVAGAAAVWPPTVPFALAREMAQLVMNKL